MNYSIPLSYKLNIKDLIDNYNNETKEITINNLNLFINKNNLIYKISSNIPLESLLDILNTSNELLIKKIYYYLIVIYLLNKKVKIKQDIFIFQCCNNEWFDIYLKTREYHICHNNHVIITDHINYNICLIFINKTIIKSFIAIIDKNCIIDCLYELLKSGLYINKNFEDIEITIIGGTIDNIDIIINIYKILKLLKLSKFINKTYLFKNNSLNRLKYNSVDNKLVFINNNSYYDCYRSDNSDHLNNPNFYSNLNKATI